MIALLWLALAASLPKYASSDGNEMLAAVFAAAPVSYKPEPRWTR